jgi:transposase InsO family protein
LQVTRRKFGREFTIEAVKLVTERGVSVAQACRRLELAESVLRWWMRELTSAPAPAFPGNGQLRAAPVMDSLKMAVWRRGRADALPHRSDQGSQSASEQFQRLPADNGTIRSMSRAGNVRDDSAIESFLSALGTERTARKASRTRDETGADVFDCIERSCNPRRRHSKPGHLSPAELGARAMPA